MIESISGREYPKKVIPLINEAKNSIDIVVFDWRWYANDVGSLAHQFNQALVQSARRGVKVRALVNSETIVNQLRGVKIYAKKFISKHLLHCKIMIIDEKLVITGSHNYSQAAFNTNYEFSVLINDVDFTKKTLEYFNNLYIN